MKFNLLILCLLFGFNSAQAQRKNILVDSAIIGTWRVDSIVLHKKKQEIQIGNPKRPFTKEQLLKSELKFTPDGNFAWAFKTPGIANIKDATWAMEKGSYFYKIELSPGDENLTVIYIYVIKIKDLTHCVFIYDNITVTLTKIE